MSLDLSIIIDVNAVKVARNLGTMLELPEGKRARSSRTL